MTETEKRQLLADAKNLVASMVAKGLISYPELSPPDKAAKHYEKKQLNAD